MKKHMIKKHKWTILKVVWNVVLMGMLIWISILVNQGIQFQILSTFLITDNQAILDHKSDIHNQESCKQIPL